MENNKIVELIKQCFAEMLEEEGGNTTGAVPGFLTKYSFKKSPKLKPLNENLMDQLKSSGKLEEPKGGNSLVGTNYKLDNGEYDYILFKYEPNSPKPYGITKVQGHGLDSKIFKQLGMVGQYSNIGGVEAFIGGGNYEPIYVDEKTFTDVVNHFKGGKNREGEAQRTFYKNYFSGGHSGTIDESRYSQFKNKAKIRSPKEQLHVGIKEIQIKLDEINRLVDFATRMKTELKGDNNEMEFLKRTQNSLFKINEKISQMNDKIKGLTT